MNETMLSLWRIWDIIYYHCTRLTYVDEKNGNIFRIVVKKYRGRELKYGDNIVIAPGDYYVKLHIHNYKLADHLRGVTDEVQLGIRTLNDVRQSLPALAKKVSELPNADQIKGIVGTTILYRGARHLGFHIQEIQSPLYRMYKTLFFKFILVLCHPQGIKRIRQKQDNLVAKRLFMSKEELFKRYLVR